jgi:hypothetical protein
MLELPEPLFESFLPDARLCLVCAREPAVAALWTTKMPIVPICRTCAADWNVYGYAILRRHTPGELVRDVLKYKLLHPLRKPSLTTLWRDLSRFGEWGARMKRFAKRSENAS